MSPMHVTLKAGVNGFEKFSYKLFNFVVCNPCQSSPSLTILVPLWFIIISLEFFHLCKVLFSGFLQFKGKFDEDQNTSKYRDRAPLTDTCFPFFSSSTRQKHVTVDFSCRDYIVRMPALLQ